MALLFYSWQSGFTHLWFSLAILMLAVVSYLDDLITLPGKIRFPVHLISVGMMLYEAFAGQLIWVWIVPLIFLGVAFINAFNFMDGINGITGIYGLVGLGSLAWINQSMALLPQEYFILIGIAVLVFLFYNFRQRALAFCGDVGSVSLAAILFFPLILLFERGHWHYLFFVSLYGVDTAYTLMYRIRLKQAIFEAHRLHYFQLLVHRLGWEHRVVSLLYGVLQLLLNSLLILSDSLLLVIPANLILLGVMHISRKKMGLALTGK
jgi:UDP-N-acetylmuramyl pentapeptide phosphotransferase/UDP-N-acetylglucosamine-1-phosphate transferase